MHVGNTHNRDRLIILDRPRIWYRHQWWRALDDKILQKCDVTWTFVVQVDWRSPAACYQTRQSLQHLWCHWLYPTLLSRLSRSTSRLWARFKSWTSFWRPAAPHEKDWFWLVRVRNRKQPRLIQRRNNEEFISTSESWLLDSVTVGSNIKVIVWNCLRLSVLLCFIQVLRSSYQLWPGCLSYPSALLFL